MYMGARSGLEAIAILDVSDMYEEVKKFPRACLDLSYRVMKFKLFWSVVRMKNECLHGSMPRYRMLRIS
jgi:hypothetical protein